MAQETFSAPLAVIRIAGQTIGKIRNLNFTENVQRGEVQGLGEVNLQEAPITSVRCQFQAGTWMITLKNIGSSTINDPFWPVTAADAQTLLKSIVLGETPVMIEVFKKKRTDASRKQISQGSAGQVLYTGDPLTDLESIGVAKDCYINSRSFEISDGAIAGKNISGIYLTPLILTW